MVDTRTDHTVIIDHTAIIGLIVIIDHKTDITTKTETDHRVITETIITETIQITGIVVTTTTEIATVQIQIIVIPKIVHDQHTNIHDHRINPDHHIIEIETLIAIMEVDTTATIEIEDPIIKITDKIVITETEIIINHGIEECNYSTDSSDEDQQILEKFYNAQENTCNSINTIKSYMDTTNVSMYKLRNRFH